MPLFVFIRGLRTCIFKFIRLNVEAAHSGAGVFFSKVKLAFLYDAGALHEEGNRRITGAQWLHVENMFMLPDAG